MKPNDVTLQAQIWLLQNHAALSKLLDDDAVVEQLKAVVLEAAPLGARVRDVIDAPDMGIRGDTLLLAFAIGMIADEPTNSTTGIDG